METITEASANHRELTKTEIDIAVAQIADRLDRVLKAQDECWMLSMGEGKYTHTLELGDDKFEDFRKTETQKILDKYQIPDGVSCYELADCCQSQSARRVLKFIKPWVSGKLTKDFIMAEIVFPAMEMDEYDYGFVFLDRPMFFYPDKQDGEKCGPSIEEINDEIYKIGSRSIKKWNGMQDYDLLGEINMIRTGISVGVFADIWNTEKDAKQ